MIPVSSANGSDSSSQVSNTELVASPTYRMNSHPSYSNLVYLRFAAGLTWGGPFGEGMFVICPSVPKKANPKPEIMRIATMSAG